MKNILIELKTIKNNFIIDLNYIKRYLELKAIVNVRKYGMRLMYLTKWKDKIFIHCKTSEFSFSVSITSVSQNKDE